MRYFLLFCVAMPGFIFTKGVSAQSPSSVGVKLGMGLSMPDVKFSPDPYYGISSTGSGNNGVVLGLFAQLPLGARWWLKPGVQVSFKGYTKENNRPDYGSYNIGNTVTYLEVPLDVVYTFGQKGTGFQVGGGPVIGFLLNPNLQSYALKQTDVGINVLTGYQMPIGFSFNLAYTHNFGNAVKNTTDLTSLKNRFLAFTVGYLF